MARDEGPQQPEQLPRETWDFLLSLTVFSGPTIPTVGRRFFIYSPSTILKLGIDEGEGNMTALAHSMLGPCVPRVVCVVTLQRISSHIQQGLILTRLPGKPLVKLWPSLTLPQREAIKAELCQLLMRMRAHRFSYYCRPIRQPYLLFSEFRTEAHACCVSRSEWDDSRVRALQSSSDAERTVALERIQRGTTGADDWDRPVLSHGDLSARNILVDPLYTRRDGSPGLGDS